MKYKRLIILLVLSVLIVLISLNVGLFWDDVLFVSKMGNSLFEHGILKWNSIPDEFDPGHPPFIATLMAFGWSVLGKSLCVSHWIMLPFIFGLLWQLGSFVTFFVQDKSLQIWAYLLVVADPTLLSHLVLINPEVIQLFFLFVAINAVLKNNIYLKVVGLAFLGLVTLRGMMLCLGVFFIDFLMHKFVKKKDVGSFFTKQNIIAYIIAATPPVIYLVWRLLTKGWIISNPMDKWGSACEFDSFYDFVQNFVRNILVLGQRFADFGRIVPILFILITLFFKRKTIDWERIKPIIIILFFSTVVVYTTSLLIKNPMGHRYYIPSYLSLGLLSFLFIYAYKFKKILYVGLLSSLIFGNFIVYPDSFSQGWNSSLAHLPYWGLRAKAVEYMDQEQLPISETASFFPNIATVDNVVLNGDMRSFREFSGTEKYVFYSNVYNLSDEDLKNLNQNYRRLKLFEKCKVRVELMEKSK